MHFGVLGPLQVWTVDGAPVHVPERKVRTLLADLLLHAGTPLSADRLVDHLWGQDPPARPGAALQHKVWQLRKALDAAEPGARDLVTSGPLGYGLAVPRDAVDASRFYELVARARHAGEVRTRADLLDTALALWRGSAYAELADEPFARTGIARLEEDRLTALDERAEARLELGEHHALVGELADLVAREPLRERSRAAYLLALYRAGRHAEALASYADLRRRLADDLGLDPSPDLLGLHQAMLERDPALDPPQDGTPPPTNLPAPPTELVGRDDDAARVRELAAGTRLVTLVGTGGVGKTRLGVHVARQMRDGFPGGVWHVDLASYREGTSVADAVATTLGVHDAGAQVTRSVRDRLVTWLSDRRVLFLLDNCEHLVDDVAALVAHLLAGTPEVRVIATSREPLGVDGEVLAEVQPLRLPDGPVTAPDELTGYSAVLLFVARAAATAPGFAVHEGNAVAVADLCRRLDGLPLALELAARRVRTLGVHGLLARLDERFRLLGTGRRDAPARQRTLRAVLDWSWDLLTEPERVVLRRLAVHVGGCTPPSAEAVAGHDVLDELGRLVDRSLLVLADTSEGPRYLMLESVAAYARMRLEDAGEVAETRRRHLRHHLELAERAGSGLFGGDQVGWLTRLDLEAPNLRAALDTAVEEHDAESAVRLVDALAWYWYLRGRLVEACRCFGLALDLPGAGTVPGHPSVAAWRAGMTALVDGTDPMAGDARALEHDQSPEPPESPDDPAKRSRSAWFLAFVAADLGDADASRRSAERELAACRERGDRWGAAAALCLLAKHATIRRDLPAAERYAGESYALFDELGDGWGRLQATEWLGAVAEHTGDYARATRLQREGLRLAERLGLAPQVADRLSWLGFVAVRRGALAEARDLLGRGRDIAVAQDVYPSVVFADLGLGLVARREGRLDEADACLRATLAWVRRVRFEGVPAAEVLVELGLGTEQRGDTSSASVLLREGLARARELGDSRLVSLALHGLAAVHAATDSSTLAARLLGAAAAALPAYANERADVDRVTSAVRASADEATFTAERDRGATLPLGTLLGSSPDDCVT